MIVVELNNDSSMGDRTRIRLIKLIMFTFNNNIIVLLAVTECDTVRVWEVVEQLLI